MGKLVAGGALCALLVGCGSGGAELTLGDSIRLNLDRDLSGALALVEVSVGPEHQACDGTKVLVAWKEGAPSAIFARRRPGCHV